MSANTPRDREDTASYLGSLPDEQVAEIRVLFPELSDSELGRFISALDTSIDQVLDGYFRLDEEEV